jgi:hypothetical protein
MQNTDTSPQRQTENQNPAEITPSPRGEGRGEGDHDLHLPKPHPARAHRPHQSLDPQSRLQPCPSILTSEPLSKTDQSIAVIDTQPITPANPAAVPAAPKRKSRRRRGRVASLPKIQRDMVNRMLWNGVPYKNIVAALDEAGFTLIERKISNWATGGYLEWRLEQEAVLENRLNQDHLLDFLRRDDAPELPEVGLQAAATRLSQLLLQKLAHAENPEADLEKYEKLIDILCRLNREMAAAQKIRDDSRRTLGRDYDPVLVKDVDQVGAIQIERDYSAPVEPSPGLDKPAIPPLLPPVPTATFLAEQTQEARHEAELARQKHSLDMMKAMLGKKNDTK